MSKLSKSFPEFSEIGGYPIFYTDFQGSVICGKCAPREGAKRNTGAIHWEGSAVECDYCFKMIESAYGETKEENK